jgi:hypothetical protein
MSKTYQDEITLSHPMELMTEESFNADEMALILVSERHDKRDLVDLVRWLILDKCETVVEDLRKSGDE